MTFKRGQLVRLKRSGTIHLVAGMASHGVTGVETAILYDGDRVTLRVLFVLSEDLTLIGNNYKRKPKRARRFA